MLLTSRHAVLEYRSNKTQHRTQHIPRTPLPYCVSHMNSAWWSAGPGWGTSTGMLSRRILVHGFYLGLHSCSKSHLVLSPGVSPAFYLHVALVEQLFWRIEWLDDVISFLVTIGSPALAGYSLQITHLNKCWITKAFFRVEHPNSQHMSTVLSSFHHVPIRITSRPPLLRALTAPHNNEFWSHLAVANKTRQWSVPLIISYVLVIVSVILSIIDSVSSRPGDIGYSIAAIWTFLLPLIIGWLNVGCEPEPSHLRTSLVTANENAWVATGQSDQNTRGPFAIEFAEAEDVGLARKDQLKPVPVFNYSRAFICPLNAEKILQLMKEKIPIANPMGSEVSVWVEGEGVEDGIRDGNRIAEVTGYCMRVFQRSSKVRPSESSSRTFLPVSNPRLAQNSSRWPPGIWKRVAIATVLALGLQWGTVGAAVMIHYIAPPAGLGCRALSFLLYGAAGTLSFSLFLASSILAHMSRPGATICRRLGKCVAIISAMGILLVCFFQITGVFNNCFCSSITFDKGRHPVVVLTINYVVGPNILRIWIGGLALAFSTALLFSFSMRP